MKETEKQLHAKACSIPRRHSRRSEVPITGRLLLARSSAVRITSTREITANQRPESERGRKFPLMSYLFRALPCTIALAS